MMGAAADSTGTGTVIQTGGVGIRKKTVGVRPWLLLDSTGQAQMVEAQKHTIMRRTGLPARDLRILDPLLSYPSTVLGRERAIVINLEHIKAIITAQEILLVNSRDPSVNPFVEELQRRIARHHQVKSQEIGTNAKDMDWSSNVSPPSGNSGGSPDKEEDGTADGKQQNAENRDGPKLLPFEFVALEACLEAACSVLDNEARTLELEAHPALDKLTTMISTLNLERVRQIKSRLVAISGRVQKVRDELEQLLDDDEDMAEMYLTDKLEEQKIENSSVSSIHEQEGLDDEANGLDTEDRTPGDMSMEGKEYSTRYDAGQNIENAQEHSFLSSRAFRALSKDSNRTDTTSRTGTGKQLDVEELEMLLEAYFVQIDGTLNKLSTLREYVDDTEDYINIMLDDKQNHLLQMGVMLSTATLVVSAFVVVAGVFGMNITIDLFAKENPANYPRFYWTVAGSTAGTIFLYFIAIAFYKQKRLLV